MVVYVVEFLGLEAEQRFLKTDFPLYSFPS